MHTKFFKFLNESSNNIKINFNGEVSTKSLIEDFVKIGIDEDDIKIFCQNNLVSYFELKIPDSFDMNLEILLSEFVERGIRDFRLDDLDINAYWFDFGNGLQSIALEYEEFNSTNYKIYSGDKELTNLLKNDLENFINAKKYNL
jgi:hypothetical protein